MNSPTRSAPTYTKELEEKQRLPIPSHRHAAPSAPWPWIDIHDGTLTTEQVKYNTQFQLTYAVELDRTQLESEAPPVPDPCDHSNCNNCWIGYPQSLFPNWTPSQVLRSKISDAVSNYDRTVPCRVHHVDVNSDGFFTNAEVLDVPEEKVDETWAEIKHHVVSCSSISHSNSSPSRRFTPPIRLLLPQKDKV